jgi:lipopolysaccharide/colanic/teichoic acid biosynthesis glycosyltransferase
MILTWAFIIIGRFDYSVKVILAGNILTPLLMVLFNHLMSDKNLQSLYVIPSSNITSFVNLNGYNFFVLSKPMLPKKKCDGLVIDFNDVKRSYEWDKFLVQAAFKKIPIYSYVQIKEMLTGQVDLSFLEENDVGGLQPSIIVSFFKRIFDLLIVLFLMPVVIPLGLFISLAIILDSPGGVFFKQQRVGLDGKNFNLIKFRSMSSDDNKSETKYGDNRITRVGGFIRKYRLDEIPQFINVLLGDMSLIGPRPETLTLVKEYEKKIPFFMYRHIVRPGISGWAQVMLGYTVGLNEKKEKLAYDLYYIKHYSISLEALIFFRTIKIVFTGAGAK